jgi:CHRD domain/PEP-CTERM motif
MKRLAIAWVVILFSCLMGTVLQATPITYQASLDGAQTVPPTGSLATGLGTVTVDPATHLLTFELSWSNLVANPLGLHIHCCAPVGANGMLAINFQGFPAATSGVYVQTVDLTLATLYNPAFLTAHGGTAAQAEADLLAALAAGNTYIDVNNPMFPGGEIRGQLATVPEPATALLLATGLASIAARLHKRRAF